jgi:hypothetical protein
MKPRDGNDHIIVRLKVSADASCGSRIMALPVRISSSSTPTPLLKIRKTPLSCARLGSQRISQPGLFAPKFLFNRSWIRLTIFPNAAVDHAHQMRILRAAAAGLVWCDENLVTVVEVSEQTCFRKPAQMVIRNFLANSIDWRAAIENRLHQHLNQLGVVGGVVGTQAAQRMSQGA